MFAGIADDLTGAVELAGVVEAGGVPARVVTRIEAIAHVDTPAIVVALRSRVAPAAQAVAEFRRVVQALAARGRPRQIFFKYCATFDSTPQGNIGPCTDVLFDTTQATHTLFCPAFPAAARTVYQGHLFVADQLVSNSPKKDDPLTPMREPDLVKVLAPQTARAVGRIPYAIVAAGPQAIRERAAALAKDGVPYAIVDTTSDADLARIAEATWDLPLMTGGSTIVEHYPAHWRANGLIAPHGKRAAIRGDGFGLVLAGSCADRTREQIARFGASHPVLEVDLLEDIDDRAAADAAAAWAMRHLQHGPVCVATGADPAGVAKAQTKFGIAGAARRAETILTTVARKAVDAGVGRLLVAGGETSGAIVETLGIDVLSVAPYVAPGIGTCVAQTPRPLALCLKSGKLGDIDMFERVLTQMESSSDRANG